MSAADPAPTPSALAPTYSPAATEHLAKPFAFAKSCALLSGDNGGDMCDTQHSLGTDTSAPLPDELTTTSFADLTCSPGDDASASAATACSMSWPATPTTPRTSSTPATASPLASPFTGLASPAITPMSSPSSSNTSPASPAAAGVPSWYSAQHCSPYSAGATAPPVETSSDALLTLRRELERERAQLDCERRELERERAIVQERDAELAAERGRLHEQQRNLELGLERLAGQSARLQAEKRAFRLMQSAWEDMRAETTRSQACGQTADEPIVLTDLSQSTGQPHQVVMILDDDDEPQVLQVKPRRFAKRRNRAAAPATTVKRVKVEDAHCSETAPGDTTIDNSCVDDDKQASVADKDDGDEGSTATQDAPAAAAAAPGAPDGEQDGAAAACLAAKAVKVEPEEITLRDEESAVAVALGRENHEEDSNHDDAELLQLVLEEAEAEKAKEELKTKAMAEEAKAKAMMEEQKTKAVAEEAEAEEEAMMEEAKAKVKEERENEKDDSDDGLTATQVKHEHASETEVEAEAERKRKDAKKLHNAEEDDVQRRRRIREEYERWKREEKERDERLEKEREKEKQRKKKEALAKKKEKERKAKEEEVKKAEAEKAEAIVKVKEKEKPKEKEDARAGATDIQFEDESVAPTRNEEGRDMITAFLFNDDVAHEDESEEEEQRCRQCYTVDTTRWRRGPAGPCTLCDKCGIAFEELNSARERARLERRRARAETMRPHEPVHRRKRKWLCDEESDDEDRITAGKHKRKRSEEAASRVRRTNEKLGASIPNYPHPASFGPIQDVDIGDWFPNRIITAKSGVHRPWVAGIHGRATIGCYSIVLNGGYEDDLDNGSTFLYTGSGGRNLTGNKRTAPQTMDQPLNNNNSSLIKSCDARLPVRVIRGKRAGEFAPTEGYRYDGLYYVTRYWQEEGQSGFKVWRFKFEYGANQTPPWEIEGYDENRERWDTKHGLAQLSDDDDDDDDDDQKDEEEIKSEAAALKKQALQDKSLVKKEK